MAASDAHSGKPFVGGTLSNPVNGGNHPSEADTEEHVDRVTARDIHDGGVSVRRRDGGQTACKCIGKGRSEGDKRDGCDFNLTKKHKQTSKSE